MDEQIASGAVSFNVPIDESFALAWLKRSRQLWQSVDYNWQRWVINYHSASQMQLLKWIGITDIASLAMWLIASLVLITGPLAWCLLRQKAKASDKAVTYYRKFCAKLARAGIKIQPGEGAKDFAERVKKQCPTLAPSVEQITMLFIRLRYQADAKAEDLAALKAHVSDFRV